MWAEGFEWTEGFENARLGDDLRDAQHGNRDKPDQRDRPKKLADASCAVFLNCKQRKQNHQRQGYDARGEGRRDDLNLDLAAQLDHGVVGQVEIVGG